MHYGDIIRTGLKERQISMTKAALWLNISRMAFYNKLSSGKFWQHELDTLIAKGVVGRGYQARFFTVEQIGEYLLTQPNLDAAVMNLDPEKIDEANKLKK